MTNREAFAFYYKGWDAARQGPSPDFVGRLEARILIANLGIVACKLKRGCRR